MTEEEAKRAAAEGCGAEDEDIEEDEEDEEDEVSGSGSQCTARSKGDKNEIKNLKNGHY